MAGIRRSVLAEEDLREIWQYIASDNPDAADDLLRSIHSKIVLYLENPRMGTGHVSSVPGLSSFPVGNYVIFYRVVTDGIEVARVLHGARNVKALLERLRGKSGM